MKKNNKRMLVAMLAMAMVLSMTACAEEPAEDTSSSESESSVSEQMSEPDASDPLTTEEESSGVVEEGTNSEVDSSSTPEGEENTSSTADTTTGSSATASKPADETPSQPANPTDNTTSQVQQQTQTSTPAATKTSSGKGPLAKYAVSVQDSSTPATSVVGEYLSSGAAYVFYSDSGKTLGTIPLDTLYQIIGENGLSDYEDEEQKAWFVEQFNVYRGLDGGEYDPSDSGSSGSSSSGSNSSSFDIDEFCDELIRLTNEEREKAGLEPYEVNETAMEFAQIRAEEISAYFSHERPNGDQTGTYSHYTFGENIVKGGRTPEEAIDTLMGSSIHKAAILSENCKEFGVGVYKHNGTIYWVQEFVWWDSQG